MSERWWKIREVLLRARDHKEPMEEDWDWRWAACAERGWIRGVGCEWKITSDGWDAAGYMSDAEAFERVFTGVAAWGAIPGRPALPPDVPWPVLRDRLARERGWT